MLTGNTDGDENRSIRRDRIKTVREQIRFGFYDDARNWIDAPGVADRVWRDQWMLKRLDACELGNGDPYRDSVAGILVRVLGPMIDIDLIRREFPTHGGRGDLDLPVRTEVLPSFPLMESWHRRYDVRRIVVETKNTRSPSGVPEVVQTEGYLDSSTGRLAMLVSRSGFTRPAMRRLESIAQGGATLILPLDDHDLDQLLLARQEGDLAVMQTLRRKETLLLQGSGSTQ